MKEPKILPILSLLLWSLIVQVHSQDECISDEKCVCYLAKSVLELEYQCPPTSFETIFYYSPKKSLRMDCTDAFTESFINYTDDYFPSLPNIDRPLDGITIAHCPLPPNSFVDDIINRFNVPNLYQTKGLMFHYFNLVNQIPSKITKQHLKGFPNLETLSITSGDMTDIDDDIFEYTPKLTDIGLYSNNLTTLRHIFKYTPKLTMLELSRNQFTNIEDYTFVNLTSLTILHLWKNNLKKIKKHTFAGLTNLTTLEMSFNEIEEIEDGAFNDLKSLINISFANNHLTSLSRNIFQNITNIIDIRLRYNRISTFPEYVFANLKHLKSIDLKNSEVEKLPGNIFENSTNLEVIELDNNYLTQLPEHLFDKLENLKRLSLRNNQIFRIPDKIFSSLDKLEYLNLESNKLIYLSEQLLAKLGSLIILNLKNNLISSHDSQAFRGLKNVENIILADNQLSVLDDSTNPFNGCISLISLDLSHNLFDSIYVDFLLVYTKMKMVNLSYNQFTDILMDDFQIVSNEKLTIDLSNNNITTVDFGQIVFITQQNENSLPVVLNITKNPLSCACKNYDLISFLCDACPMSPSTNQFDKMRTIYSIETNGIQCKEPNVEHLTINQLRPNMLACPLDEYLQSTHTGCPTGCDCSYAPFFLKMIINCTNRNLVKLPDFSLPHQIEIKEVEMNLDGNMFEKIMKENFTSSYNNVTRLNLSNNNISRIDWMPPQVKVLNLDGNMLQSISDDLISVWKKSEALKNITLYNNPWTCDCNALKLMSFFRKFYELVDIKTIHCKDSNQSMIDVPDICKSHKLIYLSITTVAVCLLLCIAIPAALYYRYQQEIKIWLYAKNWCMWFVSEEELDKDKTYDVFVSFSHKDEEFVMNNLMSVLESGPKPFKVCIHSRDWIAGEYIINQITNSVLDSRRTLVVLSNSFVESVWTKVEFRTAHTQAIKEGRARVIVVILGELDESKLDSELKTYLSTNTYVKWGDPWFWNKLKYALPHSNLSHRMKKDQKHANIMLKIDDKFELVNSQPTSTTSTPPLVQSDSKLLTTNSLKFVPSDAADVESRLYITNK